jgi:crossover junction endodeoxyribonuclease RuvC
MLVIGIDPGTATTGYGFVLQTEDGNLQAVDYGVILTPPKMPMAERLALLYES